MQTEVTSIPVPARALKSAIGSCELGCPFPRLPSLGPALVAFLALAQAGTAIRCAGTGHGCETGLEAAMSSERNRRGIASSVFPCRPVFVEHVSTRIRGRRRQQHPQFALEQPQ